MSDLNIGEPRQAESETEILKKDLACLSQTATLVELTDWLAHELNQPLAAIIMNARVALRELERDVSTTSELRDICQDIIADGQRAAETIRIVTSRLRGGVAEQESLRLDDLVTGVVGVIKNDPRFSQAIIDLDSAASLPHVRGNRLQLQQVILNLVVNGLEAAEATGRPGKIILKTRQVGAEVVLDVVDSGTGILQQKPDSIFDPLVTTKTGRLGMGLPVSYSIVTGHNGRLWAENNAGVGATFHLALPVEGGSEGATAELDAGAKGDAAPQSQELTVLIADDKESFRRAVSSILKDLSGQKLLAEAADGAEVLEKAAELNPNLILLDVGLPQMSGVEVAARLRVVAPNAKIIFLTQHEGPDFVTAALGAGALGYVLKTDAGSELLPAVTSVLRGERYISSSIRRGLTGGD